MEESNKKQNDSLILYLKFLPQTLQSNGDLFNNLNDNKTKIYKIEESVFCLSDSFDKSIHFRVNQSKIEDMYEILFKARKSKKNYYELIYPIIRLNFNNNNEIEKLDKRMWYVFNREGQKKNEDKNEDKNKDKNEDKNKDKNKNEEYNLMENDIIKFGTAKYEIIEKHISSSIPENKNQLNKINEKFGSVFYKFYPEYELDPKIICSICKKGDSSKENPKVKLCQCKKYKHYECLKKFLNKKINNENKIKKKNVTSYRLNKFKCKSCNSQYSYKFYINFEEEKEYELIDLEKPKENDYIILESLNSFDGDQQIKKIFVVKLTDEVITIGRSDDNDIGIIDENKNISNNHCLLKYDKEKDLLTIIDKSKYGTSVLIKGNVKIELNKKLYFQSGNTYIKAELKEKK